MARRKNDAGEAANNIFPESTVPEFTRAVEASLGPTVVGLAKDLGVSVEDTVRFVAVSRRCTEARLSAGLGIKDVADRLRVQQYRIREIESGHINRIQPTVFRQYLSMLRLSDLYAEWARQNAELATRLQGASMTPVSFRGELVAVKARIRLIRSFDQISHQYQGYTLCLVSPETAEVLKIAIGPTAHEKHQFQIGDLVSGKAQPVLDTRTEWADLHRASALKLERRGPEDQRRPPDPDGGIAPRLDIYRERGHRRLDPRTCQTKCVRCPWGLTMPTEIILDQWNPHKKRWRFETHCYGPKDCVRYRAGPPRTVQGRKRWMLWVDDDVERGA